MKKLSAAALAGVAAIGAAVTGVSSVAVAAPHASSTSTGTWGPRVAADPDKGKPTTMTCLSETFCVLADTYGWILVEKNGRWRASYQLKPRLLVLDVSCVSETFCAATGQNWTGDKGFVTMYDGSTWTAPVFLSATTSVDGVSCVSTTYCMAVDEEGNYYGYDGTTWSAPRLIGDASIYSVSCVTRTFCVAMDSLGGPWMFDGTSWTFYGYGGHYLGHDLDCRSTTWCVIANSYDVRTWDGTRWTFSDEFTGEPLVAISCALSRFCLAIGNHGGAYRFNGSTWRSVDRTGESESATVTCLPNKTCYETGGSGYVYRYSGGSWPDKMLLDPRSGSPSSISCPTDVFCLVVDYNGNSVTYKHAKWGRAHQRDFGDVPQGSCASPTLCVVVDGLRAFVVRNGHWSKPKDFGIGPYYSVSCVVAGPCTAVTGSGYAVTYDGTAWSDAVRVLDDGSLSAVSCVSASFCMALKEAGGTMLYDGEGWHYVGRAVSTPSVVACSSPTFCIAASWYGSYSRWNGSTWSAASYISGSHVFGLSCPVDGFCQALTSGNNVYTYAGGDWDKTQWLGSAKNGHYLSLSCTATITCTAIDEHGWARRYS